MSDTAHRFTDLQAAPNEREWRVEISSPGGLTIEALDDVAQPFDRVTLRREGAFITVRLSAFRTPLPGVLRFLEPVAEAKARAAQMGIYLELPPVLIHTRYVQLLLDLGYLPVLTGPVTAPPKGRATLFGIDVVWSSDLDQWAQP